MNKTPYRHGQFVWRELHTSDVAKSLRFLGEVLGYKAEAMTMPDGKAYTMLSRGEKVIGGLMKNPMPGTPSHWGLSVSVADVDATAKLATQAGGKLFVEPMDAGGFGRFATFADPTGGVISAWKGANGDGERAADARPGEGEFCWEQLNTSDEGKVATFYEKVFGWARKPFGGGTTMEVFHAGDAQVASIMKAPPGVPTHWLAYIVVDSLVDAHARVSRNGGKVLVPRIDVPTIGTISVIEDNVGAALGFFEAPKS